MNLQQLYLTDPLTLEFETELRQLIRLPDGRPAAILERSYFYPTGGGQEYDTGTLGPARVIEVFKQEQPPAILHVLDQEIPPGLVAGKIDAERRLRHMQHHSAQHLLTQCFIHLMGLETVSAHINGYTPSSLDLDAAEAISRFDLSRVESLANRIIYENRPIKTYFVSSAELASLPLRRPPKVSEDIRIVEIDGFDYSACGGTHVLHTGSIGTAKIVKAERQNDKIRIYFVAGIQAMELFREYYDILSSLANQMSCGAVDLPQAIQRQAEQLKAAQKELGALRPLALAYEASRLAEASSRLNEVRLVTAAFHQRPASELRAIADELKKFPDTVALLASYDGGKISLLATCGRDTGQDARRLLKCCLDPFGGRGGGDASLAQGGGTATPEQFQALFANPETILQELI